MERLIQRLRASISRGTRETEGNANESKKGGWKKGKRENTTRLSLGLCVRRLRFHLGIGGKETWSRGEEKSQRDGVAYASSRFPLCSREVERRQKEKKGVGYGELDAT